MTQFYSGMKGPVAIDKLNELWEAADTVITGAANTAVDAANAAASAAAAAGSASTASTQATNAAGSASTAVTSANSALTSATNASTSASNAATSATAAAASASSIAAAAALANTKAGEAAASASAAAGLATTAAGSATAAAGLASSASTSATTATTQALAAGTSATNAAASATTATTQATNAATSATTATIQATNALTSANQASIYEAAALSSKLSASALEVISVAAANSASSSATLAENWASKTDGTVNGTEYSAKYWANLAAGTATGSIELTGDITGSGVLGVPISTTLSTQDKVDFNTATVVTDAVGRMHWNDTDGTLDIGLKGGNVILQVGQEQVLRIFNNTGLALTDGQVVYITGSQGNRPTVALASNTSESTSSTTIGIVTEAIANNAEGFITLHGLVRKLNTAALTEGSAVWLGSTAGTATTTKPNAPAHAVLLGWVVRSHATVGCILVSVQNGHELDELHDVLILGVSDKDFLVYDSALGVWKNITVLTVRSNLNVYTKAEVDLLLTNKQTSLISGTNIKTINGTTLLGSGDLAVQPTLVNGTNIKTINGTALLGSGDIVTGDVTLLGLQILSNKTINAAILNDGYTEEVFVLTVSGNTVLSSANGSVQVHTLASNTTYTDSISNGQSITLGINASTYTTTWPIVSWAKIGGLGTAPLLLSSGINWIMLWKANNILRGAFLGTTTS